MMNGRFLLQGSRVLVFGMVPVRFRVVRVFVWLLCVSLCEGATYCVGPSATGNGSGSDWNNMKAWSSTPSRGDVWYLCGGIYTGKTFSTASSGSTVITIKKAVASD